jgi:hypothetical protein
MTNLYDEYGNLEMLISELELKKEKLRPMILQQMNESGLEKKEISMGKFSISKLKVWVYPPKVLKIQEDFKAAKAKAESTGEAEYTEKDSLRFTVIKL